MFLNLFYGNFRVSIGQDAFTFFIATILVPAFHVPNLMVCAPHLPFYFTIPLFLTLTFPLHFLLALLGSLTHNL